MKQIISSQAIFGTAMERKTEFKFSYQSRRDYIGFTISDYKSIQKINQKASTLFGGQKHKKKHG